MRFYSASHAFTCGVDLHGRTLYLCVLDRAGQVVLHRTPPCRPEAVLGALASRRAAPPRQSPRQQHHARLVKRFGKAKALSVLGHKIGRAVFHMQKRQLPFDADRFYREA